MLRAAVTSGLLAGLVIVLVEFVVGEGIVDGVVKDLDVGQQLQQGRLALERAAQLGDLVGQGLGPGLELAAVGVADLLARRRHTADLLRNVVLGTIGPRLAAKCQA